MSPKVENLVSWGDAIGSTQHHLRSNFDEKKKNPESDQALNSTPRKGNDQGQRNGLTDSSRNQ